MLNNIGLPGLLLLLLLLVIPAMGVYSLVKVPNSDDRFNYAGFWLRVLAGVIDVIITFLIVLIPAVALGYVVGTSMGGTASMNEIEATAAALGNLLGIVLRWIYFAAMESSKYQATLGKKIIGLRVVGLDGSRISFGRASGRHFGKFVSLIILSIGYFMVGWTKQKQGLHDKMAGCLVVREKQLSQKSSKSFEVYEASNAESVTDS